MSTPLLGGKLETEVPANTLAAHPIYPLPVGFCFLPVSPKVVGCVAVLTKTANLSEFCNQILVCRQLCFDLLLRTVLLFFCSILKQLF
jgi:hypothetical protein